MNKVIWTSLAALGVYGASGLVCYVPKGSMGIQYTQERATRYKPGIYYQNPYGGKIYVQKISNIIPIHLSSDEEEGITFNISYHIVPEIVETSFLPLDDLYLETTFIPACTYITQDIMNQFANFSTNFSKDQIYLLERLIAKELLGDFSKVGVIIDHVKMVTKNNQ
jgi:hypothetical protein